MTKTRDATLAARLRKRIGRAGALSFRDWMEAALYDERDGYYAAGRGERWGRTGDYRTSPERSPLFAATFARYFAALYEEMGAPRRLTIVEAGAGAGDFARGVLATLRDDFPRVFDAARYVVDERGADTRERARASLASFAGRVEFCRMSEIDAPLDAGIIFSNELLDAFAVHRVVWRGGELREFYVDTDDAGAFVWVERAAALHLAEHIARRAVRLVEGQIVEVNPEAEAWTTRAARTLGRGYVVTVDYGAEASALHGVPHRFAGTLRAFRGHTLSDDVLAHPGEQDITATIDWSAVRAAGERAGLETVLLMRQDEFLRRAGAVEQLARMSARACDEAEALSLRVGAREMILPGGMSESFQVLVQRKA